MIRPRSKERVLRLALMILGDATIAWAALAFAVFLRRNIDFAMTRSILPPEKFALTPANVLLVCVSLVVSLAISGFYHQRVSRRHRPLLAAALLIQIALVAVGTTLIERAYPRTILLLVPFFELLGISIWRRWFTRLFTVRPRDTVLVGNPQDFAPFLTLLGEGIDSRIRVVGLVGPNPPTSIGNGFIAYWGDLHDPAVQQRLRESEELIYIARDDSPALRLKLLAIRGAPGFLFVPNQADSLLTSATFGWIGDQPLVEVSARCGVGTGALVKRVIDLVAGSLIFLVSLPLWLVIAGLIAIESGRPILLAQDRCGKDGRVFRMFKFRTMRQGGSRDDLTLVREGDERVTPIGWWLRRHRLDELPQLLNVLRGEMSLIGPRPERPEIVETVCKTMPEFKLRLMVKPGLAGLAQVWSEYDTLPATKLRYDLTYICAWSLGLDLKILFRAVATALAGRGL
jgi:exopolysaccharide biosynthesis polyprenyl glycosylphosphotransferase